MSNFPLFNVLVYLHESVMAEGDFEVHSDPALREPYTIPVWNKATLGPVKPIAEYRTISETPEFIAWYRNWYRARKSAHGNTAAQADAKVSRVFDR